MDAVASCEPQTGAFHEPPALRRCSCIGRRRRLDRRRQLPHQAPRLRTRGHGPWAERRERHACERVEDDASGSAVAIRGHDPQWTNQPRRHALRLHQYWLHSPWLAHRRSRHREGDRDVRAGASLERSRVLSRWQANFCFEWCGQPAERYPVLRSVGQGRVEGGPGRLHASRRGQGDDSRLLDQCLD